MVKCPKGTQEQVLANNQYLKSLTARSCTSSFTDKYGNKVCKDYYPEEQLGAEEEDYLSIGELDVIRADARNPPTTEDEITYLLINHFIDILIKCWDGTPCMKQKVAVCYPSIALVAEDAGEMSEIRSVEKLSSYNITADYLNDLYKSRSQKLSKDTLSERGRSRAESRLSVICKRPCDSRKSERSHLVEYEGNEEEETVTGSESELPWKIITPDEDVRMSFQNGIWYEGRVSRRMMDGDGKFFWEDGGSFQGEFLAGTATGQGRLQFPNLNVYEGSVHRGFRHGEGLQYFNDSPVLYAGEWWLGKKNGHGLILYSDPTKSTNFYKGSWMDGMKEGFGYRQYPSGSKYIGYWHKGKRHGTGIMFWCNHDIYRGQWRDGLMDGYGEYTWNGFVNKTFSYPRINRCRGFWECGKRNGCGVLEMSNGSFLETVWVDNEKDGPGAAVCTSGMIVAAEKLFKADKAALVNEDEEDLTGLFFRKQGFQSGKKRLSKKQSNLMDENQLMSYFSSMERAKAIPIPIHTPVHAIDLTPHLRRLQSQKDEFYSRQAEFVSAFGLKNTPRMETINDSKRVNIFDVNQSTEFYSTEEKLLRYSIMINLIALRNCYDQWATAACQENPPFKCVLLRLFFWELLTQSKVQKRNFSLIDIDKTLVADEFLVDTIHHPFERIQFWQFLHFLLTISWYLYGRYVYCENVPLDGNISEFLDFFSNQSEKVVLASAFSYFLTKHIFENGGKNSDMFKNNNLVPMEGMYLAYKSVGEPHSAKDFLAAVCMRKDDVRLPTELEKFFEKLPEYKTDGKNVITFADELCYLPSENPFNHPEINLLKRETDEDEVKSELSCFAPLGPTGIVKCLVDVCPVIAEDGLIVDMEYQLTFLEFYKAVIACAQLCLKKKALAEMKSEIILHHKNAMDEYKRSMKEYEKQKEATVSLTKKTSYTKKVKK